jgi:hypothetical protein
MKNRHVAGGVCGRAFPVPLMAAHLHVSHPILVLATKSRQQPTSVQDRAPLTVKTLALPRPHGLHPVRAILQAERGVVPGARGGRRALSTRLDRRGARHLDSERQRCRRRSCGGMRRGPQKASERCQLHERLEDVCATIAHHTLHQGRRAKVGGFAGLRSVGLHGTDAEAELTQGEVSE